MSQDNTKINLQSNTADDFTILPMDNFYKDLTEEQLANVASYNFDIPAALDFDEMFVALNGLLNYQDVEIPTYSFSTNSRLEEKTLIKKSHFILFEGILALYDARIREMMDFKIYVNEDADVRLLRRIKRDISERGRSIKSVLNQWYLTVKPSYDEFVAPTLKKADIIVNGNPENWKAINFIVSNLKTILQRYKSIDVDNHKSDKDDKEQKEE